MRTIIDHMDAQFSAFKTEAIMNQVHNVKTNDEIKSLNLSFYTLCKLGDVLNCVDPTLCFEHRMTHQAFADKKWVGELTLDQLGNFVSFY